MIEIHRTLVIFLAIMTTILVDGVGSYPTFANYGCQSRSYGRIRIVPRKCPPCHVCRNRICEITSCNSRYDLLEKNGICVRLGIQEVRCVRLTGDVSQLNRRVKNSWQLPLRNDSSVSRVGIEIDKAGNAFIGFIDSQHIRFLIFNADNVLVADIDSGSDDPEYRDREVDAIRLGDEFCLVKLLDSKPDAHDDESRNEHQIVKCINIANYVNATASSVV